MLYREIIAVCSQIHTKHINTLCGQNVELLNVKLVVHTVTIVLHSVVHRQCIQNKMCAMMCRPPHVSSQMPQWMTSLPLTSASKVPEVTPTSISARGPFPSLQPLEYKPKTDFTLNGTNLMRHTYTAHCQLLATLHTNLNPSIQTIRY